MTNDLSSTSGDARASERGSGGRRLAVVTGATGFTGSHLVRRLLREGYRVRAVARPGPRTASLPEGIEIFPADLSSAVDWWGALDGADVVFHVAATYREAHVPEAVYWSVNYDAPRALFEAASQTIPRARIVHCSTIGVHGHVPHPPANEDSPYEPGDPYQASKAEADKLALRLAANDGANIVVARPAAIYGPGDTRLLKLFRMVDRGVVPIVGKAEIFYHLVYVEDLVEGLICCAVNGEARGRSYILGEPRYYSLRELLDEVADATNTSYRVVRLPLLPVRAATAVVEGLCRPLGLEPPLHRRRVDFYTKSRAFDVSRAERELGFRAPTTFAEGARRAAAWYREHGYLKGR